MRDRSKNTTIDPIKDPDPKYSDDSTEMKIAKYFHSVLLKSNPKQQEPNWQSWCKDLDLFLRKVKPTREEIKLVIDWAHDPNNSTDRFSWIPNLRSPKKLREHFEKILLQAKNVKVKDDNGNLRAEALKRQTDELLKEYGN